MTKVELKKASGLNTTKAVLKLIVKQIYIYKDSLPFYGASPLPFQPVERLIPS